MGVKYLKCVVSTLLYIYVHSNKKKKNIDISGSFCAIWKQIIFVVPWNFFKKEIYSCYKGKLPFFNFLDFMLVRITLIYTAIKKARIAGQGLENV